MACNKFRLQEIFMQFALESQFKRKRLVMKFLTGLYKEQLSKRETISLAQN